LPSYAVMISSRAPSVDSILMMLEDRQVAEEIAIELRDRGQRVDVHELTLGPRGPVFARPATQTDR